MAELAAHAERYVTLREVAHLNLRFPSSFGFVSELPWVPVSVTELHLTAHYFPIAIRLRDGVPSLGAILSDQYLIRAPITATGDWQGGYQPIALRSYPLR